MRLVQFLFLSLACAYFSGRVECQLNDCHFEEIHVLSSQAAKCKVPGQTLCLSSCCKDPKCTFVRMDMGQCETFHSPGQPTVPVSSRLYRKVKGVDCGPLAAPTNGVVSLPGGTRHPATATYACSAGCVLQGTTSSTCQANGAWAGTPPTCIGCVGGLGWDFDITTGVCYKLIVGPTAVCWLDAEHACAKMTPKARLLMAKGISPTTIYNTAAANDAYIGARNDLVPGTSTITWADGTPFNAAWQAISFNMNSPVTQNCIAMTGNRLVDRFCNNVTAQPETRYFCEII